MKAVMKGLLNFVKLNLIFVLLGHLTSLAGYTYQDYQLYVYIVVAGLLTQLREATLFEE